MTTMEDNDLLSDNMEVSKPVQKTMEINVALGTGNV